jgi:hypothetical protein
MNSFLEEVQSEWFNSPYPIATLDPSKSKHLHQIAGIQGMAAIDHSIAMSSFSPMQWSPLQLQVATSKVIR